MCLTRKKPFYGKHLEWYRLARRARHYSADDQILEEHSRRHTIRSSVLLVPLWMIDECNETGDLVGRWMSHQSNLETTRLSHRFSARR